MDELELREFVLKQREFNDAEWLGLRDDVGTGGSERSSAARDARIVMMRRPWSWNG